MRQKLILNDLHIGVKRVAGTTPVTAYALRQWLLERVRAMFMAHLDKDIVINGDLFDSYDISLGDALAFHEIASEWLDSVEIRDSDGRTGRGPELVLGMGNHDVSKDSSRLSTFAFIARILKSQYPGQVRIVTEPQLLWPGFYMVPHCVNQELFNLEIEKVVPLEPSYIFIHANFDNNFAVQSDHSLNMSREQAQALTTKGHLLIFGHEHQARNPMPGVVIVGNQFPSSIADCLGNPHDKKQCLVLPAAYPGQVPEVHEEDPLARYETWRAEGSYAEIDWREIPGFDWTGLQFIRVTGQASAAEAAAVLQAVSKLRQKCDAFVVTSSVKIEGMQDMPELQVAAEEMKAVNVLEYLFENLEPEQVVAVKVLLAEERT